MTWINTNERLPKISGNYKIKNNTPSCNNGEGECEFNGNNWIVPDMIKNFFKITHWWEEK
jgi:hypothetical protein